MKNLILIIHASLQQDLADKLRSSELVTGFTFSHVEGHGSQTEDDPMLSIRDKVVGYIPRVRVDVLLDDQSVDSVLEIIARDIPGISGHCVYWVIDVMKHGRL